MGKALHSFFVHLCVKMSACQGNLTKCWGLNISFRGELQLVFSLSTTCSVAYLYRISVSFTHERKSIDLRDSFYSQDWHNHALFLFKNRSGMLALKRRVKTSLSQFSLVGKVMWSQSAVVLSAPVLNLRWHCTLFVTWQEKEKMYKWRLMIMMLLLKHITWDHTWEAVIHNVDNTNTCITWSLWIWSIWNKHIKNMWHYSISENLLTNNKCGETLRV